MKPAIKILGTSAIIAASIILGLIAYGEITRPTGFKGVEGEWITGNGLRDGSILTYRIEFVNKTMLVNLKFEKAGDNWLTSIIIDNKTTNVTLTKNLVAVDIPEGFEEWNDIRRSLLWIIDYVFEPKPLVGNAVWSTVTYNLRTVDLKVVAKESISIDAGEFEAYKIGYYLGYTGGGELWIVKDMPLPVKAEVLDINGNLEFRYMLLDYSL